MRKEVVVVMVVVAVQACSQGECDESYILTEDFLIVVVMMIMMMMVIVVGKYLAALRSKFGNMTVRVSLSENGRFDGPEDGTLWSVMR